MILGVSLETDAMTEGHTFANSQHVVSRIIFVFLNVGDVSSAFTTADITRSQRLGGTPEPSDKYILTQTTTIEFLGWKKIHDGTNMFDVGNDELAIMIAIVSPRV